MFLFLSFIVAFVSIWYLIEMASYSYPYSNVDATPVVILFVYSVICIIKSVKESDNWLIGEDFHDGKFYEDGYGYNGYNSYNTHNTSSNRWDSGSSNYNYRNTLDNVEVFAPNKPKEYKSENDDRPLVYHIPSQKEAREKIAELEKSRLWRMKRWLLGLIAIDITEKYYKPHYVKEEIAVKGIDKEDNSRFMPKTNVVSTYESKEYNEVAKMLSRSCDIAFEDDTFLEDIINNEKNDSKERVLSSSASVNNL